MIQCYLQIIPPDDTEEGEMASALLGGVGVFVVAPPAAEDVLG